MSATWFPKTARKTAQAVLSVQSRVNTVDPRGVHHMPRRLRRERARPPVLGVFVGTVLAAGRLCRTTLRITRCFRTDHGMILWWTSLVPVAKDSRWKDKHNTHHAAPNVHGSDPDIVSRWGLSNLRLAVRIRHHPVLVLVRARSGRVRRYRGRGPAKVLREVFAHVAGRLLLSSTVDRETKLGSAVGAVRAAVLPGDTGGPAAHPVAGAAVPVVPLDVVPGPDILLSS
ncbi:MAG: hypothetical protein BJ554DRAFT_3014, partial [Olpidium bornovanus]